MLTIETVNEEMQKSPADKMVEIIGHHVIDKLSSGASAEDTRTIAGAIGAMKREAKKNASGGCGCLTDEEGFAIVDKYYGFEIVSKIPEKKDPGTISLEDFF